MPWKKNNNTTTAPKCEKKKEVPPESVTDNTESIIDKILEDNDNQQSTSTSTKRGRNEKETATSYKKNKETAASSSLDALSSLDNILNDTSHKKNKETVASSSLDDLLSDVDDLQGNNHASWFAINFIYLIVIVFLVSNHELNGVGRVANVIEIDESESPNASLSYSKASTSDNFVSSHRDTSLTTLRRLSPALESRSSTPTNFFHSHRVASRSLTAAPSNSSPFSESRSTIQETPDTFGHFNPNNVVVPSPFNEMTIYQLCSWLCVNPNVLQLANNMHSSMQVPIANGGRFAPSSISSNLSNMPQNPQNQEDKVSKRTFL